MGSTKWSRGATRDATLIRKYMGYVDGDYAVGGSGKTVEIDESFIDRGMLLEEAEQSDHRRWR